MKLNNEIRWSSDRLVCFEPVTHTYWYGKKQLKGVTSYIGELHEKFDSAAKAIQKSDKPWELLREWKLKGEKSRDEGTALHNIFETWFERSEVYIKIPSAKELQAIRFIKDYFLSGKLKFIECESIVYDLELGIASMRDCVAADINNAYYIFDWKTSGTISTVHYNRWMFSPYQFLPDANFYHHSLQLRLYQKMSKDYSISDCYIVHFEDDKYSFIKAEKINLFN